LSSHVAILQRTICAPARAAASNRLATPMTVKVLLFASYADTLGTNQLALDFSSGSTVGDVLGRVRSMPGADALPPEPLVAVNERYARRDQVLSSGDEVAIIPPVAGG
jgi:molybdopterin converting factor subunit 1